MGLWPFPPSRVISGPSPLCDIWPFSKALALRQFSAVDIVPSLIRLLPTRPRGVFSCALLHSTRVSAGAGIYSFRAAPKAALSGSPLGCPLIPVCCVALVLPLGYHAHPPSSGSLWALLPVLSRPASFTAFFCGHPHIFSISGLWLPPHLAFYQQSSIVVAFCSDRLCRVFYAP